MNRRIGRKTCWIICLLTPLVLLICSDLGHSRAPDTVALKQCRDVMSMVERNYYREVRSPEIVAGVLQDHKRALIVGEKSFGQATVQTIIALDDGTGLRLTTAPYYTPHGEIVQGKGIRPELEPNISAKEGNVRSRLTPYKPMDDPMKDELVQKAMGWPKSGESLRDIKIEISRLTDKETRDKEKANLPNLAKNTSKGTTKESSAVAGLSPKAKRLLRRAERGNAVAQVDLGNMYGTGTGAPLDYKEAAKWYRKAAEQGNPQGMSNLGYIHMMGLALGQDYSEAVKLFRKAIQRGNTLGAAENNLGYAYTNGYGVAQDYGAALTWYRLAAKQGSRDAQYNLGLAYLEGRGLDQDHKKALKWFRRSAEQKKPAAQYKLGWMYHQGIGVKEDRKKAIKWYKRSAKQGNQQAKGTLELMEDD